MTRARAAKWALGLLLALAIGEPRAAVADVDGGGDAEEIPLAPPTDAAKTKPPEAAAFLSAPRVRPTRRGPAAAGCRAILVREWLRVRCPVETFAISLLGGDADVAFWIDPSTHDGEVLMPVRPASRHVVQLWKAGKDAQGGFMAAPAVLVQQHWPKGAPAPVLTLF